MITIISRIKTRLKISSRSMERVVLLRTAMRETIERSICNKMLIIIMMVRIRLLFNIQIINISTNLHLGVDPEPSLPCIKCSNSKTHILNKDKMLRLQRHLLTTGSFQSRVKIRSIQLLILLSSRPFTKMLTTNLRSCLRTLTITDGSLKDFVSIRKI